MMHGYSFVCIYNLMRNSPQLKEEEEKKLLTRMEVLRIREPPLSLSVVMTILGGSIRYSAFTPADRPPLLISV